MNYLSSTGTRLQLVPTLLATAQILSCGFYSNYKLTFLNKINLEKWLSFHTYTLQNLSGN